MQPALKADGVRPTPERKIVSAISPRRTFGGLPQPMVEVNLTRFCRGVLTVVDEGFSPAPRLVMVANEQRAEARERPDPP